MFKDKDSDSDYYPLLQNPEVEIPILTAYADFPQEH